MNVIAAARELMGEQGDPVHPEYERALVELTCLVLSVGGMDDEARDAVRSLVTRRWPARTEAARCEAEFCANVGYGDDEYYPCGSAVAAAVYFDGDPIRLCRDHARQSLAEMDQMAACEAAERWSS